MSEFSNDDELRRFQWKKKLLLFGGIFLVGLLSIFFFASC